MTKQEIELSAYQWEEIVKGMQTNKKFVYEINWFKAEFLRLLDAPFKWQHDELLCNDCNSDCSKCKLVQAGHLNCHETGSWWQNIITHKSMKDARAFQKFHAELEADNE